MKRIRKEDYTGNGIYIDLDIEYIPYQKLIYEPNKYLNKNNKYYFHCKHGIKSREVVMSLESQGYDVTQVI
jgi:rhodanese-related sulfurtransferase